MNGLPPILVVIPVSGYDQHLAADMMEWAAEACPAPNHPCLLAICNEVQDYYRGRIKAAAAKAFARVYEFEPVIGRHELGWPDGPNALLRSVADFCAERAMRAWYFFEPDNTPLCPGWMDTIEAEYNACGKPFWGVIQQSWTPDRSPVGFHLVGTAVMPRDILRFTSAHLQCPGVAFDVAMQSDIVGNGCGPHNALFAYHTNLVVHGWLTQNFRRESDGVIRCDRARGRIVGQEAWALPRDIHPGAVVHHGCKDGSIIRLLRAERNAALAAAAGQVSSFPITSQQDAAAVVSPEEKISEISKESVVRDEPEPDPTLLPSPEATLTSTGDGHGVQGDPATGLVDSPHETPAVEVSPDPPVPPPKQRTPATAGARPIPVSSMPWASDDPNEDPWQ